MMKGRFKRREADGNGLVQSYSMEEPTSDAKETRRMSSLVKKPFLCLVGMKPTLPDDDCSFNTNILNASPRYVPPGGETFGGFEAEAVEKTTSKKSKKKQTSVVQTPLLQPHTLEKSRSLEEPPNTSMDFFSLRRNRSYEELPSHMSIDDLPQRNRSFAETITIPKRSDPLDAASIKDVSRALREMDRKLKMAQTEGKRVSRSKVMKALLTVVDQLDEEYDYNADVPNSNNTTKNTSNESMALNDSRSESPDKLSWGKPSSTMATMEQALPLAKENNQQLYSPPVEALTKKKRVSISTKNPTKTDRSFKPVKKPKAVRGSAKKSSRERGNNSIPKTVNADSVNSSVHSSAFNDEWNGKPSPFRSRRSASGGAPRSVEEPDYISSSSDDESADEETTLFSEETGTMETSTRGSFAHAVSPRGRTQRLSSSGFDFFPDMNDPGVADALRDLMWIQTPPPKGPGESRKAAPRTRSTGSSKSPDQELNRLRRDGPALYKDEEDSEHEAAGEESTAATTRTSSSDTPASGRQRSWWRRTRALKPPLKDTPNVGKDAGKDGDGDHRMKVTVATTNVYPEKWKDVLY